MSDRDYTAFITYSHSDDKIASWLQKSLESYRIPAHLIETAQGAGRQSLRLGQIFRDREDLSAAGDLGEAILDALARSEYLIVVCSPASAQSRWVNREIEEFKKSHDADRILCLIASGEPFVPAENEEDPEGCFPPALASQPGRESGVRSVVEPAAADIRKGGDGRRLAKLKIVSALLGVGLDAIVQRDTHRRHRRMLALTVASLTGMVVMAFLSIVAVDARNSEQQRRAEAEDLIEFMLGDLRNRLDAVGRLDVLDSVGEKAVDYYSQVELSEHSDSALGRRARAFHLLGEVDDLRGDLDAARLAFTEAYESTDELVRRSPQNGDLIFDHAQSVYWVGYLNWRLGNFVEAERAFKEYLALARRLTDIDPQNHNWIAEFGYANYNLGANSLEFGQASVAIGYLEQALSSFRNALAGNPDNLDLPWTIAQTHAWLADSYAMTGDISRSVAERQAELGIYVDLLKNDPANQDIRLSIMNSNLNRAFLFLQKGNVQSAIELLVEARQLGDELRLLDPDNTFVLQVQAGIYAYLAEASAFDETRDNSLYFFEEAERLVVRLVEIDATVLEWQLLFHKTRLRRLKFLFESEAASPIVVTKQLQDVVVELEALKSEHSHAIKVTYALGEAYYLTGVAQKRDGDPASAAKMNKHAIDVLANVEADIPPTTLAILSLAYSEAGNGINSKSLADQVLSMEYRHPGYLISSATGDRR